MTFNDLPYENRKFLLSLQFSVFDAEYIVLCIGCFSLNWWLFSRDIQPSISLYSLYANFKLRMQYGLRIKIAMRESEFSFRKTKRISIFEWRPEKKRKKRQKLLLNYQSTFYQCHLSMCSVAYEMKIHCTKRMQVICY